MDWLARSPPVGLAAGRHLPGHVGREFDKLQVIAAVQWQLDDPPVLNDCAYGGVLGRQQRRRAADFDGFSDGTDLQHEVDPLHGADL